MGRLNKSSPNWTRAYDIAQKLHVMAKIMRICKLVKVAQKLRCARSQFSDGTNYVSLALFVNSRTVRCCSVTFSQFSILVCFSVYAWPWPSQELLGFRRWPRALTTNLTYKLKVTWIEKLLFEHTDTHTRLTAVPGPLKLSAKTVDLL